MLSDVVYIALWLASILAVVTDLMQIVDHYYNFFLNRELILPSFIPLYTIL